MPLVTLSLSKAWSIKGQKLIAGGIAPLGACQTAIAWALSDDAELQRSIEEVVTSVFED